MPLTFDDLHVDILHQICGYLYLPYLYRWDDRWYAEWMEEDNLVGGLLPLSLVCKRLRAQTLPWIFRDVTYSLRKPPIPSHLWPYILVFRFCDVSPRDAPRPRRTETEMIQVRRDAGEQLARLPSVHTVHLWISSPSEPMMDALTALQGRLSTLILYDYPVVKNEDLPLGQLQGICRLVHVGKSVTKMDLAGPDEPRHQASGELLFSIVTASAFSLVHLDVPAQHTRLDMLRDLRMTSLQTLVLRGPVEFPGPNLVPIISDAVPNLQILEVHLYVIGGSTPQFTIMNEEVHAALENRHTPSILSNLQEFTLANPNPFDCIFLHLPSDLQVLSLAAVPFYQRYRRFELALSANAASHVLVRCPPYPLPELKISIQGELPLWLFRMIATAFPSLERLELRQRFRLDEHGEAIEEEQTLESYATALAVFPHLRVLSFDWPLTNLDNPDESAAAPYERFVRILPRERMERHDVAALVARSVTSLREIRFRENFTATNTTALPWLPFSISRSGYDPEITKLNNDRPDFAERRQVSQSRPKSPESDSSEEMLFLPQMSALNGIVVDF